MIFAQISDASLGEKYILLEKQIVACRPAFIAILPGGFGFMSKTEQKWNEWPKIFCQNHKETYKSKHVTSLRFW